EVGEELGGGVVLVAVPGSVPPHAYLRKPLAAEHEIALPTGTRLRFRHLIVEGDFELDVRTGGDRFGDGQLNHGLVVFVAIIGSDEVELRSQIALASDFDALDF